MAQGKEQAVLRLDAIDRAGIGKGLDPGQGAFDAALGPFPLFRLDFVARLGRLVAELGPAGSKGKKSRERPSAACSSPLPNPLPVGGERENSRYPRIHGFRRWLRGA